MAFKLNFHLRTDDVRLLINALKIARSKVQASERENLDRIIDLVKRAIEDEDYGDKAIRNLLASVDHSLDPASIKDKDKLEELGFPSSMIKNLAAALTKIVQSYEPRGGKITRDEAGAAKTVQDLVDLIKKKLDEP